MSSFRAWLWLATFILAACGGGNSGETPPGTPTASAGDDQTVTIGNTVTLDGSNSSDPDGDLLQYHWTITDRPSNSQASLSSTTVPNPVLIPDLWGLYEISLTVSDGTSDNTDSVVITVESSDNCQSDTACGTGEYCQKATGQCEATGSCTIRPETCITLWAPVCGCDGRTYGNACNAAAAGVNVLSAGECPL